MENILQQIREDLKASVDTRHLSTTQNFFKEKIKPYGVPNKIVHEISKKYFKQIKHKSKDEIFALCELLWKSGYLEESFIACNWSFAVRSQFVVDDFYVFEKWIDKYINNWASCDTFCNHTLGELIEMYPELVMQLKRFTKSDNRWTKRAAAVSLIILARKGKFLTDVFEIADILMFDPDDLVQKGYGWLLKVASKAHQNEVFQYVMDNKHQMPRTSLRYAIEKMPKEHKQQAMAK